MAKKKPRKQRASGDKMRSAARARILQVSDEQRELMRFLGADHDNLYGEELSEERYQHIYGDLPDENAKRLANLIYDALMALVSIARAWSRMSSISFMMELGSKDLPDDKDEVLGGVFKEWNNFCRASEDAHRVIVSGVIHRFPSAGWPAELLGTLDTVGMEFYSPMVNLASEMARSKRYAKLADRLYEAYRQLAYVYLVPVNQAPKKSTSSASDINSLAPKYRKAFDFIKSLSGPTKGQTIASKLGIHLTTFQKHYVPALRPFGLKNEGDGYFVESS